VINIFKLINGRSVSGVGSRKIALSAIVVDDAHACLTTASEQFSLRIGGESAELCTLDFGAGLRSAVPTARPRGIETKAPLRRLCL
jgi:hypothetical protein